MGAFNHVRRQAWAALMAGLMITIGGDATSTTTTSATAAVSAIPTPGTFEVDLLFPRNSTYTPQAQMPIVFAVQNPTLASQLEALLYWQLWEGNNWSSPGSVTNGVMELGLVDDPPLSDPFWSYRFANTIAYPDGFWTLSWDLVISNCSQPLNESRKSLTQRNTTIFTISSSGQAPDLVAATSADMCGAMEASAFNVTSFGDLCGVLGASPTTNPCAATLNPAALSRISASASAEATLICLDKSQQHPGITCPTSTSAASSADAADRSRMPPVSTLLVLLAMLTALIHLG
jgi:hypothetical protein